MKLVTTGMLLFFTTLSLCAKPISVDVLYELQHSTFTGLVVIDGYDGKGTILFHSLEFSDTLQSASIGGFWENGIAFRNADSSHWTGNLPFAQDTVLIVTDSTNRVSVFAKKTGKNYRFWSPYHTLSLAYFKISGPVLPLPGGTPAYADSLSAKTRSWDGCLIPVEELPYLTTRYFPYTGYAVLLDGKPAFACDFADSSLYYLDGLETWDEKYRDKRIVVRGDVTVVNSVTVFRNWRVSLQE